MIELYTPLEIIEKAVQIIETERKVQKLQQKELALKANIPLPTYKQFIYAYKISFENIHTICIYRSYRTVMPELYRTLLQ